MSPRSAEPGGPDPHAVAPGTAAAPPTVAERPVPVSVIVPVFRAGRTLGVALESIARTTHGSIEVIATLDGSQPEAGAMLEAHGVRVLEIPHAGPAAARNHAVTMSTGEILFFTDADVEIFADTISRGVAAFRADPELDALFGSYTAGAGAPGFFTAYKNYVHHLTHQDAGEDAFTFWTGCGFVRRSVFDELGGFDDGQRFLSDVEFGYRMHLAGKRIRIDKSIQVVHHKHYDLRGLVRSDFFGRAVPWSRLMMRHRTVESDLNLKPANVLSVPLSYLTLLSPALGFVAAPLGLVAPLVGLGALGALNHRLIGFTKAREGTTFALGVLLTQWGIYLISGAGVVAALLGYRSGGR